mmetsp:Transcript_26913/g.57710  ORF Transcript_26913/g.57710 Transcript_26913/m.57710 type:complete len:503 (+) Transcript_26913:64-1572(+)
MRRTLHLPLALLGLIASGESASLRQRHESESAISAAPRSSPNTIEHSKLPPSQEPEEKSLIAMQFSQRDPHARRDKLEMIQNGELSLAAIRYSPTSFSTGADHDYFADDGAGDEYYTEVYGVFCAFDPSVSKQDPAKSPTTDSIMSQSEHCGEHPYTIPLREVMQAVRFHDDIASSYSSFNNSHKKMKQLQVSGLLFHEGYSGAGLLSNVLASAFNSTRVISEHVAVRDALGACDTIRNRHKSTNCSSAMQQRLVRDVVTLLSRTQDDATMSTSNKVEHFILKLSSASSAYLPELRFLYPHAQWTFLYRNADDALAKATQHKERRSACIMARRNPTRALTAKSTEHNINLESLSHHEICALRLSSLLDTAGREHDESGTGMLVSYDDDILSSSGGGGRVGNGAIIVDVILPYLGLQEDIDADPQGVRDRVEKVLSVRSNHNSRGARRRGKQRQDHDVLWDGEEVEITEEVGAASKVFLSESMDSITRFVNMEMLAAKIDSRR